MRFDDRLDTILQIDPSHPAGRQALWCQLVDMLSQSGGNLAPDSAARGLAALAVLRSSVPLAVRAQAARSVARRCRFSPLVIFLAKDEPPVVVALFDSVQLTSDEWHDVLPVVGPLARSRLRNRRDLPVDVIRLLDNFGSTDFALPPGPAPLLAAVPMMQAAAQNAVAPGSNSSIADLVQRIEAYRNRPAANDPQLGRKIADLPFDDTEVACFRCDADGLVRSITGLPRGVFVGLSLASAARPADTGVDAGIARAFGKRQAIVDGRLLMVDAGPWSGQWLIAAAPQFDRETGRFLGYRGTIEHGDMPATKQSAPAAPARPRSEGMRQMVHELRSPLNAISGFAQLIEGQYFGPVSNRYRDLARSVMNDATVLTSAFEDIDLAARLDTGTLARSGGHSDVGAMMMALIDGSEGDGLTYIGPDSGLPDSSLYVALGERDLHQLLFRFIALATAQADGSSPTRIAVFADAATGEAVIEATGQHIDAQGVDATNGGQGGLGSSLGSAFARRLVDRMAANHGGSLRLATGKALLNLPCARHGEERIGAGV